MIVVNSSTPSSNESVVEWIRTTCETYGDRVACIDGERALTFGDLWTRSSHLALELLDLGVQPGDFVGLWAEQTSELLISIVGIMASGAAYVPLDPAFPVERLRYIAANAELNLVVAPDYLAADAEIVGVPIVLSTRIQNSHTCASKPATHG